MGTRFRKGRNIFDKFRLGNIAIFDGSFKAHLGSNVGKNVGKIEINTDTFEEYVLYYLRSDFGYGEFTKQKKETTQESISIRAIREVIVKIPTLLEQQEIVHILDNLFEKEQCRPNLLPKPF